MDLRKARARTIQKAIGQILLHERDPIGVSGELETQDEYNSYVGGVYRLLASGATTMQLAEHLAHIENDRMGLSTLPEALIPIAEKLREIDIR